jgi:SAM-dependent methyltransferase
MSGAIDPIRVVREGYDQLDGTYRDWVARMLDGPRASFLAKILELIPPNADVLEIGCGPGTDAGALAEGRRYTGIDLSGVQLEHARAAVPDGNFLRADVLEVELPAKRFDAVVAFCVRHIPAARPGELVERIASWLRPDGWLCASFGTSDNPGEIEPMWLGAADMYFSSRPPERTEALLGSAGFEIRFAETITEMEPGEGPATFWWVIAQRMDEAMAG